MASVARSLTRTALSFARQTSSRQKSRCPRCLIPVQPRRPFSVTPLRFRELDEQAEDELAESEFDSEEPSKLQTSEFNLSEFNFKAWDDEEVLEDETRREIDADVDKIETQMPLNFMENSFVKVKPGFWAEGEEDEMAEVEDEEQKDDAITSMAHTQLEEHRELREYARIVAWDMPSLSNLAKPFELPPETHVLRFRYTTYMGESHPAEPKVVVEFCTSDLTPRYLNDQQRLTLLKLLGTRYDPDKDLVRMSCEKFTTAAQNKRFLGDLINTLIKEAKEGDSFADVPLDLRHHKPKRKPTFPESWVMTDERKAQLEAARLKKRQAELEGKRVVDGNEIVDEAMENLRVLAAPAPGASREKVTVPAGGRQKKPLRGR